MLYLSQEDILQIDLPLKKVISIVESGLREHGQGLVENPPKPGIHSKANSFIHAMPAYFRRLGIGGIKWVSGYPDNRRIGLPQILGLIVLNDMETGVPKVVMDCRWITAVRTAAVTAITAKYCAKEDAESLGIIGCGVQGRYNLLALKETISTLRYVKIFDINSQAMERYKAEMSNRTGVEIAVCTDAESAARGSDMILTATQRLEEPIIRDEWFESGCLGFGLEASRAWHGNAILNADKFITDDWKQTVHFAEQGAFPDGLPELYAELGKVVCGAMPGREDDVERILAINIGLALEDIVVANHIYEVAKNKKSHQRLVLMEREI